MPEAYEDDVLSALQIVIRRSADPPPTVADVTAFHAVSCYEMLDRFGRFPLQGLGPRVWGLRFRVPQHQPPALKLAPEHCGPFVVCSCAERRSRKRVVHKKLGFAGETMSCRGSYVDLKHINTRTKVQACSCA